MSARSAVRLAALTGVVSLITLATPSAGTADSNNTGSVKVLNTETVQVYMAPDGSIESKRVYEQLALTGHGTVTLDNPVSTDGLRNLNGFSGFTVKNGDQVTQTTVDGVQNLRSVSNYDKALPASVKTEYWLDGVKVAPNDVVGKSGHLKAQFTVTNATARTQQVQVDNGKGGTVTKTVSVPVPLVGSLTTTLPQSFSNVVPGGANAAGDGAGGVTLSYTMTLFPPLGSTTSTFGYSADITDGMVPRVNVALLPVDPLASPTFKSAADSYQGGAKGGTDLVTGAAKIDTNLLKLRDGAASVLAGLIQLSAGADQLHSGLATSAAPGAVALASGAGQLDAGAKKLHAGTSAALSGAKDLKSGLGQISGGLSQLAGQLPAAGPGIQQLIDGVNQISAGFGAVGQTGTLIDGLNLLNAGAAQIKAGLTGQLIPGVGLAKGGVDQVKAGLDAATTAGGSIDQLIGGLNAVLGTDCGPVCTSIIGGSIIPGVQQSKTDLITASAGLGQVSGGLAQVLGGLNTQIVPGLDQLIGGSAAAKAGAVQLKAGNQQVHDGLVTLKTKLAAAIAGVLQLNSGAATAYTGSGALASGLGQVDSGTGTLASGTGDLSAGAKKLSDGLGTAATGSGQLSDGLKQAAAGTPQLVDGAQQLSTQGMGALKKSGVDTAVQYGELYSVIKAGSDRAKTESMAFGAPQGAEGLTAYAFTIRAANGMTAHNFTRGAAAAVLVSLGGAAFALRRRWA